MLGGTTQRKHRAQIELELLSVKGVSVGTWRKERGEFLDPKYLGDCLL